VNEGLQPRLEARYFVVDLCLILGMLAAAVPLPEHVPLGQSTE
jgi:hypothetical protein